MIRQTFQPKYLGFSPKEVRKLEELVQENQAKLLEAWDGYFGSSGG
ncbi:hypothetical protein [Nostoc sp.]